VKKEPVKGVNPVKQVLFACGDFTLSQASQIQNPISAQKNELTHPDQIDAQNCENRAVKAVKL